MHFVKSSEGSSGCGDAMLFLRSLNKGYNFLIWFELVHFISHKDYSIQEIFSVIESTVPDDMVRNILLLGVQAKFEKSNDFGMIANLYNKFKSNTSIIYDKSDNNDNTDSCRNGSDDSENEHSDAVSCDDFHGIKKHLQFRVWRAKFYLF